MTSIIRRYDPQILLCDNYGAFLFKNYTMKYLPILLFLILGFGTTYVQANAIPSHPALSIAKITQDSTIVATPEPGERVSKVAIGLAGFALGAALLYAMFISLQAGGALIILAVLACTAGLILGLASLFVTKKRTQARKRSVAAVLMSIVMLMIGVWQAGKALDQG